METVLGWIVGGFALAFGVWLFVAFIAWLESMGGLTEEQARRQSAESQRRWMRENGQQDGSVAEKP